MLQLRVRSDCCPANPQIAASGKHGARSVIKTVKIFCFSPSWQPCCQSSSSFTELIPGGVMSLFVFPSLIPDSCWHIVTNPGGDSSGSCGWPLNEKPCWYSLVRNPSVVWTVSEQMIEKSSLPKNHTLNLVCDLLIYVTLGVCKAEFKVIFNLMCLLQWRGVGCWPITN